MSFHFHQGVDIGGQRDNGSGTLIAVVAGTIVEPTTQSGYGQTIHIEGDNGYWYKYAHCHTVHVQPGERVEEKQVIGLIGRTTCARNRAVPPEAHTLPSYAPGVYSGSFGAHLHFEVLRVPPGRARQENTLDNTRLGTIFEAQTLHRVDPISHLRQLGPWGGAKLYFPLIAGGQREEDYEVTEAHTETLFDQTEQTDRGGYFPLGANQTWHGGVHLEGRPGAVVRAPFRGEVIAARLDPDPSFASGVFGSTNFILMAHDVPADLLSEFRQERDDDDNLRGTVGVRQHERFGRVRRRNRRRGRGRGQGRRGRGRGQNAGPPENDATNEPELVDEVRAMLQRLGHYHPEADIPGDPRRVDDEAFDTRLLVAILNYQAAFLHPPDGLIDVPGRTYRRLLAETDELEQAEREARGEHPNRVYSLFMHLGTQALDDGLARRVPWLARAAAQPTAAELEAASLEAQANERAIADERRAMGDDRDYRLQRNVGRVYRRGRPVNPQRPMLEEDIRWVQRRLIHHGYDVEETGECTEVLESAIRQFQEDHTPGEPDGVVSRPHRRSRPTASFFRLRLTPTELAQPAPSEEDPVIDPLFVQRCSERTGGVANVLVGENLSPEGRVPVYSGEPLWVLGELPALQAPDAEADAESADNEPPPRGIATRRVDEGGTMAGIHWEIFTEEPLFARFEQLEDDNDDRSIDVVELINQVRQSMRENPPNAGPFEQGEDEDDMEDPEADAVEIDGTDVMSRAEIAQFYASAGSQFLHRVQARFHSEWALDPARYADSAEARGWNRRMLDRMIAPYMWWNDAEGAVPNSPLVWHYNPIAFLAYYRSHLPAPPPAALPEAVDAEAFSCSLSPGVCLPDEAELDDDADEDDELDGMSLPPDMLSSQPPDPPSQTDAPSCEPDAEENACVE